MLIQLKYSSPGSSINFVQFTEFRIMRQHFRYKGGKCSKKTKTICVDDREYVAEFICDLSFYA